VIVLQYLLDTNIVIYTMFERVPGLPVENWV